jgi:hypothetical protein
MPGKDKMKDGDLGLKTVIRAIKETAGVAKTRKIAIHAGQEFFQLDKDTNADEAWKSFQEVTSLLDTLERTEDRNVQASYSSTLVEGGVFTITTL